MLQVSGELVTLSQQGTSARSLGTALCCQSQALQHSIWSATNTPAHNTPQSSMDGVPLLQLRAAAEQRSAEVRSPSQGACCSFACVYPGAAGQPLSPFHHTCITALKVYSKQIGLFARRAPVLACTGSRGIRAETAAARMQQLTPSQLWPLQQTISTLQIAGAQGQERAQPLLGCNRHHLFSQAQPAQ